MQSLKAVIQVLFQSTLPSQGATINGVTKWTNETISIHAPLTGSDSIVLYSVQSSFLFQSTLPSQGATPMDREE